MTFIMLLNSVIATADDKARDPETVSFHPGLLLPLLEHSGSPCEITALFLLIGFGLVFSFQDQSIYG
jgi:hypothetical protein